VSGPIHDLVRSDLNAPAPAAPGVSSNTWSGASIFGSAVSLITISVGAGGRLRFDARKSVQIGLQQRDQVSTRALQTALQQFTINAGIREIVLRTGARGTAQQARVEAHICEAALYLLPNVTVHPVSATTLGCWMEERGLPRSGQGPGWYWQAAAGAALYAAHTEKA
jgi:hypothetical protein